MTSTDYHIHLIKLILIGRQCRSKAFNVDNSNIFINILMLSMARYRETHLALIESEKC